MNTAVNILGFVEFFFILVVIVFRIHNAVKHTKWYNHIVSYLQMKFKLKKMVQVFDEQCPSQRALGV